MSPERTPVRKRAGRDVGGRRIVAAFKWENPENVPGAILPPSVQREIDAKLRAIDEAQARAMVSARNYVIYR